MIKLYSGETQDFDHDLTSFNYFYGNSINFFTDNSKIKIDRFFLRTDLNEKGELTALELEFKNLPVAKLREICRYFGHNLYSEDFLKLNQLIVKLDLKEKILNRYISNNFQSLQSLEQLLAIPDNRGKQVLLNLNNYLMDKLTEQ